MTTIALPALWLAGRDRAADGAAAPVGAVGLADATEATAARSPIRANDPLGTVPVERAPDTLPVQYVQFDSPTVDSPIVLASATYRRSVPQADICLTNLVPPREAITVVNLDTGRSVDCYTRGLDPESGDDLVLRTDAFASFADVTDAPIHVEIHVEPDE